MYKLPKPIKLISSKFNMHIPFLMKKLPFRSLLRRFAIFENYLKDPTDVIKLDLTQPDWKAKVLNKVKEWEP